MEGENHTLLNMIIKRCLLFCGALWVTLRFAFLYRLLYPETVNPGAPHVLFLLFSFGSVHAVMAVAYGMAGIFRRYVTPYGKLLSVGQAFAFGSDILCFSPGFGFLGFAFLGESAFPAGIPLGVSLLGMTILDFLFLIFLLLSCNVRKPIGNEQEKVNDSLLPDMNEIAVDEEE